MKNKIILILLSLVITSCAWSNAKIINSADGTKLVAVSCGGQRANYTTCLEQAGKICSKGYDILNEEHSENQNLTANQSVHRDYNGAMIVHCKYDENNNPHFNRINKF